MAIDFEKARADMAAHPYKVWSLDPLDYQYSWENSRCEGRFATLDEAVQCARAFARKWTRFHAESAETPQDAQKKSDMHQDDVWIDGPGVINSECAETGRLLFDLKAEISETIRLVFEERASSTPT